MRIGPNWRRTPEQVICDTFNRLNTENPDLSIDDVIAMTASHHYTTPSHIITALWG
jgi:hypothetical protein